MAEVEEEEAVVVATTRVAVAATTSMRSTAEIGDEMATM